MPNWEWALHKSGCSGDGFAEELDAFLVAAVQDENACRRFHKRRRHVDPREFGLVVEPVDSGQDSFGLDGIRRHIERFVGFFRGFRGIVVFERQAGQQFLGRQHVRIGVEGFVREIDGLHFEASAATSAKPEQRIGLLRLDFQRFVE